MLKQRKICFRSFSLCLLISLLIVEMRNYLNLSTKTLRHLRFSLTDIVCPPIYSTPQRYNTKYIRQYIDVCAIIELSLNKKKINNALLMLNIENVTQSHVNQEVTAKNIYYIAIHLLHSFRFT